MSTVTLPLEPITPTKAANALPLPAVWTLADLQEHLGDIPLHRIRGNPAPGTATVRDVETAEHCELIDGVLVEKAMGYYESYIGTMIATLLSNFVETHDLGIVIGEDGTLQVIQDQVRAADCAYISWERIRASQPGLKAAPRMAPDLAVEVLCPSNTPKEMDRKLSNYFSGGTKLVWIVDPLKRLTRVYTSPTAFTEVDEKGSLDGSGASRIYTVSHGHLPQSRPAQALSRMSRMFGLLNLHKPPGVTSRDVVNQIQRIARPHKVGHAGTLDPLATGVLIVCVGQATRLIEYVQRMRKRYVGTFLLGRQSPTEDIDGVVEELLNPPIPTAEQIAAALPRFLGEIQQRPPAFSALKVQGQRAYDLARKGEIVELAPRPITIHEITLVNYEYPQLTFDILCGSGTYVRSLGRDMAQAVGTEAVMAALVRRAIGPFQIEEAVNADSLTPQNLVQYLRPPEAAVAELPAVHLSAEELNHICHGRPVPDRFNVVAPEAAAFSPQGQLAAIVKPEEGKLRPVLCFLKPG